MPLSAHKSTTAMIATIHTLKSKVGMDDDTYRDFLHRETGQRSAKSLNVIEAGRVINKLREAAGEPGVAGAVIGLDTPIGGKLRALWIAGYDLAIVRDRTDRAMLAFLERQTGVSHVRFLQLPGDASAAIEGLKSWLAREAGVVWPGNSEDVTGAKRAVLNAQWMRLIAIGAVTPWVNHMPLADLDDYAFRVAGRTGWNAITSQLDDVQQALGRKLRAAIEKRAASSDQFNQDNDHGV